MKSIPDNLTYEQFKAIAERQPSLEGEWLYRLQHKSNAIRWADPNSDYILMNICSLHSKMRNIIYPSWLNMASVGHGVTTLPCNMIEKLWLNWLKYGKTRLWYIIREWDICNEDPDAHLPLSTPVEALLDLSPLFQT